MKLHSNHTMDYSPLMELPLELRNNIYRFCLPELILPDWRHRLINGHPAATEPHIASSFVNLLLCNRKISEEVSGFFHQYYPFVFDIAPSHASILDAQLHPWHPMQVLPVRISNYKITNIVLKANWDQYKGAPMWNFQWNDWKWGAATICGNLLQPGNLPSLQNLTLDWSVQTPYDVLHPTAQQWQSISPYFEELHDGRPDIRIEVVVWREIPETMSMRQGTIRTSLEGYGRALSAFGRSQTSPFRYAGMDRWSE